MVLQLIDFILTTHPAYHKLKIKAEVEKSNIHQGIPLHVAFTDRILNLLR